jgi:rhodanese-related sulfurtransferase
MSGGKNAVAFISPADAWAMMQSDTSVTLIDVRSDMEYLMIGHPKGAVNVAWIDAPDWTVDKAFVANVRKALLGKITGRNHVSPLLLICRSGNRSLDAANTLAQQGLTDIHVIEGGFEGPLNERHQRSSVAGWRYDGLPWEQC